MKVFHEDEGFREEICQKVARNTSLKTSMDTQNDGLENLCSCPAKVVGGECHGM